MADDTTNIPAGLDEFLNSGTEPQQATSPTSPNEPPGLNEFLQSEIQQKYGSAAEQAKTALEAAGEVSTFGLSTGLETSLGVNPEDIRARKEYNPTARAIGTVAGLLVPGSPEAEGLEAAGKGAESITSKLLGLGEKEGATVLQRAAVNSTRAAAETALLQSGDEVSKMLENDPEQSMQTAAINIGLSGILGGALGVGMTAFNPMTKSLENSNKLGQLIEDFRSRINEHLETPDKVGAITDELSNFHSSIKSLADEVYGPEGLKAKDIAATVPEMNQKIADQTIDLSKSVQDQIDKMNKKVNSYPERLTSKLQDDLDNFHSKLGDVDSPIEIFDAIQDFKQKLQSYAKFDQFIKPVDEAYDFVKDSKQLAFNFREALEDPGVWGKAADRQNAINKAFVQFKPALDDFEKKFTSEIAGDRALDPGKVNTYLNQLEKPNGDLKKEMLLNFINAGNKYKDVIADTHANLGIESPITATPLNHTLGTLKDLTPGAKLADMFIKRGILDAGGKTIGAGIGAAASHAIGASKELGALFGAHVMGPLVNSVLPVLGKLLYKAPQDAESMVASAAYGNQVQKGQKLLESSMSNLFEKRGKSVVSDNAIPTTEQKAKLKEYIDEINEKPEGMTELGNKLGTYLPKHVLAGAALAGKAVQNLSNLEPAASQTLPLDTKIEPSKSQKYEYDRTLELAEQPLMILDRVKDGSIAPHDVQLIQSLYPQLYGQMLSKVMDHVASMQAEKKTIPYNQRLSLSIFTGQPIDSTMTPQSILAAQPMPVNQPNMGQNGTVGKKSASSLSKIGQNSQTSFQSNVARQQRDK